MFKRLFVLFVALATATGVYAQEEIELVPFTDDAFGISGVVPEGWTKAGPGVTRRAASPADAATLIQQAAPADPATLLNVLTRQLGLAEAPESSGEITTDALTWTLYEAEVSAMGQTIHVDLALAPADSKTLLVLLQAAADEHDALHEQVFLPAVNALQPAQPAEATAEATEETPYISEDVTFENGGVTLAGTLTLPPTDGPHPAIVLISGSGPQDRDSSLEPVAAIKPFALIADYLTREGIAVLRYDDRGVAESTGDFASATSLDFAADAMAAVSYLKSRPDIDAEQVGVLGHSEGGMIAPLVVNESDAAFLVLMAGQAVNSIDVMEQQSRRIYEVMGYSDIEPVLAKARALYEALIAPNASAESVEPVLRDLLQAQIAAMPEAQRAALGDADAYIDSVVPPMLQNYLGPWFPAFLAYDPTPELEKLSVPVLALYGALDTQVDAEQNAPALDAILTGNDVEHEIVVFPDANHLFQSAKTGGAEEYATLEQTFTPDFLPTLGDWLLEHVTLE